jgi:hypothetical protein
MKITFKLIIGMLFIVVLFNACSDDMNSGFDPDLFASHIKEESRTYKNCNTDNDSCSFIIIKSLTFNNNDSIKVLQKISTHLEKLILQSDSQSVSEVCDAFILDYDHIVKDTIMKNEEYALAWFDVRETEVVSVNKRVLSYKCSMNNFYGGAHPNEYIYLRNFDPITGDSLGLGMIFKQNSIEELRSLAEFTFRKKYDLSEGNSFEELGYWFEDDTFEFSTNFAFTEQGLWFYYNNYEIAPYSMGTSEIVIPYALIMHLFE